jgi:hypothetical protein
VLQPRHGVSGNVRSLVFPSRTLPAPTARPETGVGEGATNARRLPNCVKALAKCLTSRQSLQDRLDGGHVQSVSVLFSDLAGFATFNSRGDQLDHAVQAACGALALKRD